MRRQKRGYSIIAGICCILMISLTINVYAKNNVYNEASKLELFSDSLHSIMGESSCDIGQMINYYEANNTYPSYYANSDAPTIYDFCRIYMEECETEGVRAEVAFCQAMKETGFLKFGGRVNISQYNFAGIGATDSGAIPNTFSSVREGIRGQVQHLKAYASTQALKNPCVDPRYHLVAKGCAPYVEWLGINENPTGKGWASSLGYGYSILNDYIVNLNASSTYTTWYNGVNYAAVYNPTYYMKKNQDAASAFGGSGELLIAHFVNYGMIEGRRGNSEFDVHSYKKQYVDLRNVYGNNLKNYYLHYINYGKAEGRQGIGCTTLRGGVTIYNGVNYAAIYNYSDYITLNKDVENAYRDNDMAVLAHFVNYGMIEGRRGNSEFDVHSYRNQYADLRKTYGNDLTRYYLHYMSYGEKEGRQGTGCSSLQGAVTIYNGINYAPVYNYNDYLSYYTDVKKAFNGNDEAVLAHFVNYGMNEGRQGIRSFNIQSYRNQYVDLRKTYGDDLTEYYLHYMSYGEKEGRQGTGCSSLQGAVTIYNGINYASVYNYNDYINQYVDVKKAYGNDDLAVLAHFVNYGMSEGRQGSSTFNVQIYKNRYSDLQSVYENNLKSYYLHFIQYGKTEGRTST